MASSMAGSVRSLPEVAGRRRTSCLGSPWWRGRSRCPPYFCSVVSGLISDCSRGFCDWNEENLRYVPWRSRAREIPSTTDQPLLRGSVTWYLLRSVTVVGPSEFRMRRTYSIRAGGFVLGGFSARPVRSFSDVPS